MFDWKKSIKGLYVLYSIVVAGISAILPCNLNTNLKSKFDLFNIIGVVLLAVGKAELQPSLGEFVVDLKEMKTRIE